MSLFKPLCKFCATVNSVREIGPTVRKALQAAQSGTPGESHILTSRVTWLKLGKTTVTGI